MQKNTPLYFISVDYCYSWKILLTYYFVSATDYSHCKINLLIIFPLTDWLIVWFVKSQKIVGNALQMIIKIAFNLLEVLLEALISLLYCYWLCHSKAAYVWVKQALRHYRFTFLDMVTQQPNSRNNPYNPNRTGHETQSASQSQCS